MLNKASVGDWTGVATVLGNLRCLNWGRWMLVNGIFASLIDWMLGAGWWDEMLEVLGLI